MKELKRYIKSPISPIEVKKCRTVKDYLTAFSKMSFQARKLGQCLEVLIRMVKDKNCLKILTLAGALVPAGLSGVLATMIEEGFVDLIVSTGANVTHDLVEGVGQRHYLGSEHTDDGELLRLNINRIHDTFLPEACYLKMEDWMGKALDKLPEGVYTPSFLVNYLGARLRRGVSFLRSAAKNSVPVFVPAFSDSEMALNIVVYNQMRKRDIRIDELSEIKSFAEKILTRPKSGVIILGGGVPRNWTQQIFPYLRHLARLAGRDPVVGYTYGIRIGTDIPHYGGLSGSTFEEAITWGKYRSDAVKVSLLCDITIALPLLVGALLERLGRV